MSQKKITYIKLIYQLEKKMKNKRIEGKLPVDMPIFQNLISGVPAVLNGYDLVNLELGDQIDLPYLKKHLLEQHKIKDTESAIRTIHTFLNDNIQWQYEQFLGFWKDQPEFDLEELDEKGRMFFESCKTFAKQFYPILKDKGFAGFDFGEAARMARECYACGFLDKKTVEQMLNDIGLRAFRAFDSWEEFAISYLCGSAYFMYRASGMNNDYASMMFQNVLAGIEKLFFTTKINVWNQYAWLEGKKYFLGLKETRKLIDTDLGCFVTDRISIDGLSIGSMVHEEPASGQPDSGWRFFAGDETPEYIEDLSNTQVFSLNTICNYDESISPLLDAPIGTTYYRGENGEWVRQDYEE